MILTTSWPKGKKKLLPSLQDQFWVFFSLFGFVSKKSYFWRVILNKAIKCKWLFSAVELLFRSKSGILFVFHTLMASAASGCKCSAPPSQTTPAWCNSQRYTVSLSHVFQYFYTLWTCISISHFIKTKILFWYIFLKENRLIFKAQFNSRTSQIRFSFSRWIISCFSFL